MWFTFTQTRSWNGSLICLVDLSYLSISVLSSLAKYNGYREIQVKNLKHIKKQGDETPGDAELPCNIGSPDVSAAPLCDVDAGRSFGNEFSKWNRAKKVDSHNKCNTVIYHL